MNGMATPLMSSQVKVTVVLLVLCMVASAAGAGMAGASGQTVGELATISAAEPAPTIGARGAGFDSFKQSVVDYAFTGCSAANCVNVQDRGIVADGRDVLNGLQRIVDELGARGGGTVYLPQGLYGINGSLDLKNKVTLVGDGSATILRQRKQGSALLMLHNVSDVMIANMTIDQAAIVHQVGQSNHGVFLSGVSRVGLKGLTLKGPFQHEGNQRGDGIYMRHSAELGNSRIVVVLDCTIEGASRNGIALVGAEHIWLENVSMSNFSGNPNAGLDLEPEAGDTVKLVTVKNMSIIGEELNLYTHQGRVFDILLDNIWIPDNRIFIEGNIRFVQLQNSTATGLTMVGADSDLGKPRAITVLETTFVNMDNSETVYLAGESVTFDSCLFVGGTVAAVRDTGTTERVTIRNSTIRGSKGDGISIYRPARIELADNKVYNNARDGMLLGVRTSPVTSVVLSGNNEIYGNGRDGIRMEVPQASVSINGANIHHNEQNGLFLTGAASANIRGNTFDSNKRGIFVSDYDVTRIIRNVSLISNTVTNGAGTQLYGIYLNDGPGVMENVVVRNNTISGSTTENLYIKPPLPNPNIVVEGNVLN